MESKDAKALSELEVLLSDRSRYYFSDLCTKGQLEYQKCPALENEDSVFFHVDKITYEEKAPWKEALENVLSAARIQGVNFLYCIKGDQQGVNFYYGLAKDKAAGENNDLEIAEYGKSVLAASLKGNFRGSCINSCPPEEKEKLLHSIEEMKQVSRIEGVAGSTKDDERFQSVDRLVDVMQGDEFCVLVVASAITQQELHRIERLLYEGYSSFASLMKYTRQDGKSSGSSKSHSTASGESQGSSHSESKQTQESTTITEGKTEEVGNKGSKNGGRSKQTGSTNGTSDTWNAGKSNTTTDQTGTNEGSSTSESREYLNKHLQDWVKYCDEVVFKRLDYGRGKGLFHTAFYVMSNSLQVQKRLENTVLSLYSGKEGNRVPLYAAPLREGEKCIDNAALDCIKKLQLPKVQFKNGCSEDECRARALLSQCVEKTSIFSLSNWMTTNELSMIAGLPRKEVVGLPLCEEVEFGLNPPAASSEENADIHLGCLIKDGEKLEKTPVVVRKSVLDKHLFITGVTGSGKTTTCQRILSESNLPYLVIEPVKTEYRELCSDQNGGTIVFTLGNDKVAPFRLNPLEFMRDESITSHVDMLKASMEAAFDMEAAIPQLIEAAIYRCYEEFGWDITTNENRYYDDPFAPGVCAFPTLKDLLDKVPDVVNEQGFDTRLNNDYVGSIKARLQGLTLGAKGEMLNTKRSIDFDALLDKKVILELDGIKNGGEKSLIMGFILSAFNEAVRQRYARKQQPHSHILLVEEAHRLLSKYQPGDNPNKKLGVETFSDMLAEIRKYGECLIIVDQIPNKMAEDVLKNTNTKIVHRVFAQDDKEAIGNTIALTEDQKRFLSNLGTGRAIVFSNDYEQAVQVAVDVRGSGAGTSNPVSNKKLRNDVFDLYAELSGIFCPLAKGLADIDEEAREKTQQFMVLDLPCRIYQNVRDRIRGNLKPGESSRLESSLKQWSEQLSECFAKGLVEADTLAEWIITRCLSHELSCQSGNAKRETYKKTMSQFLKEFSKNAEESWKSKEFKELVYGIL